MIRNIGIILSGGTGVRFGDDALPKQYQPLGKKMVVDYVADALSHADSIDTVVLAGSGRLAADLAGRRGFDLVPAGESRNLSIRNALDYIKKHHPDCMNVFISEAARPFLTGAIVDFYVRLLEKHDAVITTSSITDSLGSTGAWVTDRRDFYLIQAPEAFRFQMLNRCFSGDSDLSATVQQLPVDARVMCHDGLALNPKITYRHDLIMAEALLASGVFDFNGAGE
ncbi:IspD/TarI family cytidylyltransferase [Castellaniella hirudinis]|uniref:IspD/TarI family cytidylyltransferase n=1 Tax=Castellaniella hirudinis TaxID=1144617 RepID=UPI0039C1E80D